MAPLALVAAASVAGAGGDEPVRLAARAFGSALTQGRAALLRPLLPTSGKVHLAMSRIVPEDGHFGAAQVEALFAEYFGVGAVRSFEVLRIESDGTTYALAHARATLTDRQGRPGRSAIHLAFQTEESRWVLREIKETPE